MAEVLEGRNFGQFVSSAALGKYRRVTLDANNKLALCTAAQRGIGTNEKEAFAADENVPVLAWGVDGTRKMVAAGAIADRAYVFGAANGKIDDAVNGDLIGRAMEAAGADGDIIEVLPLDKRDAAAHIADPAGGATIDAEARTAINAILVALENAGITLTA